MLVSIEEAREWLGVDVFDETANTWLQLEIGALSAAVENYCGRRILSGPGTTTIQGPVSRPEVLLKHFPVTAVTSVIGHMGETAAPVPSTAYSWFGETGEFYGRAVHNWSQYDEIEINYIGGFTETPPSVKSVLLDLLKSRFMTKDQDPTRAIKTETVYEVSSVTYESQRGVSFHSLLGKYTDTLDMYKAEPAVMWYFRAEDVRHV